MDARIVTHHPLCRTAKLCESTPADTDFAATGDKSKGDDENHPELGHKRTRIPGGHDHRTRPGSTTSPSTDSAYVDTDTDSTLSPGAESTLRSSKKPRRTIKPAGGGGETI
ncbi:hypothetical protein BV898_09358 [Hypsibius exemplaris]|uniref:Uncharacterized protein n=1 Tax=Hypsibius exemplaris TaxID=2072580 RepID=A0A1W0WMV7_HYPEX|nr:hypothetical protein BV898_09358 [Hypsibius exemplaris]